MLRAISGLAKPPSGEIWFDGRRIDGKSPHRVVKSGIGHVPAGRMVFEPTVGLSPLMCTEVGEIVKKINASGIMVLLVEQNCRVAFKLAQRASILELGSVVAHDSTDNLAKDENVRKYYLGGGN